MDRVESVETKGNVVESVPEFQESSSGNVTPFAVFCLASERLRRGKQGTILLDMTISEHTYGVELTDSSLCG